MKYVEFNGDLTTTISSTENTCDIPRTKRIYGDKNNRRGFQTDVVIKSTNATK